MRLVFDSSSSVKNEFKMAPKQTRTAERGSLEGRKRNCGRFQKLPEGGRKLLGMGKMGKMG